MLIIFQKIWSKQPVRFLIIGGVNVLFGYSVFSFVQFFWGGEITYFGSLIISQVLGICEAFVLYRWLVFAPRTHILSDFLRFLLVYVPPFIFNLFLLPFFITVFNWNVYLSQAIAMICVAVISYLGHKFFTFAPNKSKFSN